MIFNGNGLFIDDYETILADVQQDFRDKFGNSVKTDLDSAMGLLQALIALRESHLQEVIQLLYQSTDPRLAEGVRLDQANSLLGITRLDAAPAQVLGTATGTPSTSIPDGTRVSVGGYIFETSGGPYAIGGGGTIGSVLVVAQEDGEVDVSTLGAWTILDAVSGFDSFDDDSQTVDGRLKETDTELRARAEVERYRRSQANLDAIEAAVSQVEGVTYVRAWHNITTDPTDANGIPYLAINVVVQGGADADIAQAIWDSGPAGHLFYGTDVSEVVVDGPASHTISFDRVDDVGLYVRATLTTSTSEESAPDALEDLVDTLLLAYTAANWDIGTDVLPYRLSGALAGIAGVDAISIETSLNGVDWTTTKRSITIREQAILTEARITFVEN